MATPNYAYEKRQRELAKKKKQEEKDARKGEARAAAGEPQADPVVAATAEPAVPAAPAARVHRRPRPG